MAASPAPRQAVAGRACGACTLCCKVQGISEIGKPAGQWCAHCAPGKGCGIYDTRPGECRDFFCMWIVEPQLGPEWKPDQSRMVLTATNDGNGVVIRCDPGFPQAWRREPYLGQIRQWAKNFEAKDGLVMVWAGNRTTIVASGAEFPLGEVTAADRIIRDYAGGRLVNARVERAQ